MNIIKITMPALRNEEHFQLMTDVKEQVEDAGVDTLNIAALYAIFLGLYLKEDAGLEKISKSLFTDAITDADAVRDSAYRGLVLLVETNHHSLNPAKVQAAARIQFFIDHYGNFIHKSYNEETASLYNLLQDITTRCADAVVTLNALEWVNALQSTNQAFNDLMNQRFADQAGQEHVDFREIRKAIDKAYSDIVNRINAFALVGNPQTYAGFINAINERILYFKHTLAVRKGKAGTITKENV